MSVRSAARRHREELGGVVAEYWDKPTPKTIGVFVGTWLLLSGLTLVSPGETILLALAPTVVFGVLLGLALLYVGNERLLVCERGLIIGSFAPGLRPYVIRYDQIVPGSVVPVTGAGRYTKETDPGGPPRSRRCGGVPGPGRASTSSGPRRKTPVATVAGSPRCWIRGRSRSTVAGPGSPAPDRRPPSMSRSRSPGRRARPERSSWPRRPLPRPCVSSVAILLMPPGTFPGSPTFPICGDGRARGDGVA